MQKLNMLFPVIQLVGRNGHDSRHLPSVCPVYPRWGLLPPPFLRLPLFTQGALCDYRGLPEGMLTYGQYLLMSPVDSPSPPLKPRSSHIQTTLAAERH